MGLKKNGKKSVKAAETPYAHTFILDPRPVLDYLKGARAMGRKAAPQERGKEEGAWNFGISDG
jgi:hypothetical protein